MAAYSEDEKKSIWQKGIEDAKYDPQKVRKDACGAWMIYDDYNNRDSVFGCEIDHIYPEAVLRKHNVPDAVINNKDNLRPLNWGNNLSKGDDYPDYHAKVKAYLDHNVDCDDEKTVNEKTRKIVSDLLKDYSL